MYFFIPQLRCIGIFVLALLLNACNTTNDSADASGSSKNTFPAGAFVWHDLITHDIEAAQEFYGGLFGWEFVNAADREGHPYVLAKLDGRYAAGILQLEQPNDGSLYSRWLGYMTVNDIDTALSTAYSAGGNVVESSRTIAEVGKVAAIQDSQNAVLGLVETRFDPSKITLRNTNGAIVWDELLASDSSDAADFYSSLAGYKTNTIERRSGLYILLESGETRRAGILQNPFDATDPFWLSYIAVSDPAAIAAKTQALGGKVLIAPSAELRDGTMALIQDPEGVVLALQKWPL
jgi:predicted enzyme related to lactoylglutathione lyase